MNPLDIQAREALKTAMARRAFLGTAGVGVGAAALSLLERKSLAAAIDPARAGTGGGRVHPALPGFPHHAPKAKRVIYLHMEGAPPTLDMFDRKPTLDRFDGDKCPDELMNKERFAFIKGHPKLLGHKHGWIRASNGIEMWRTDGTAAGR